MRKRFALRDTKKAPERVLEAIKNDIRKYIKREKRKPLPENTNFWRVDCRFAKNENELEDIKFEDIMKNINEASAQNCESFMIELIATAIQKEQKTEIETPKEDTQDASTTK